MFQTILNILFGGIIILLGLTALKSRKNFDDLSNSTLEASSSTTTEIHNKANLFDGTNLSNNKLGQIGTNELQQHIRSLATKTTIIKSTPRKNVNYRRNLNVNLSIFKDKTIKKLKDLCIQKRNRDTEHVIFMADVMSQIKTNLHCTGGKIKKFIETLINGIVSCFSKDNHPSEIEMNKTIEEVQKRYCFVHRMSILQMNNACYEYSHYTKCVVKERNNFLWVPNLIKYMLSITEGETNPFNKEKEDNLECKNVRFSKDCYIEGAENCSPRIKHDADRLASKYWSAMNCVEE